MRLLRAEQKEKMENEEIRRRRVEQLRRRIEEARKRRQHLMLLILLAVLEMQESFWDAFQRSYPYRHDPDPAKKLDA